MADLTAREGPCRLGDVSGEDRDWANSRARRGMRERGRAASRRGAASSEVGEASGLPEKEISGENGGEEGSAGEDS